MSLVNMNEDLIRRIDELLESKGLSRSGAAKKAGLSESYIRDLEKNKGQPNLGKLKKLADFLDLGIDELLPNATHDTSKQVGVEFLQVRGVISAGNFRDISVHSQDEDYQTIPMVPLGSFPKEAQYALLVEGDSMDERFPDGTFVVCVDFISSGLREKPGMTLHIERTMGGGQLVEITLKEYRIENGQKFLYPRSSNLKHKPIPMTASDGSEIHIKGFVIGSFRPEIF